MRRFGVRVAIVTLSVGLWPVALTATGPAEPPGRGVIVGEGVEEALRASPFARVVVLLDVDPALADRPDHGALRQAVAARQERALQALHPGDFRLRSRPRHAPIIAGELNASGLERLRRAPGVLRVDLEREGSGALAQSVPLVRADVAQALGYTGAGIVVGEVDSGVDTDHPDLIGAVVEQACLCHTDGGCCANGGPAMFGPGAAEDVAGHGTLVAGVITSNGVVAPRGVAPDAGLVVVRVTNAQDHTCCMSDVTDALDWILENRPDVAAINVSVVSQLVYPGNCDFADGTTTGMTFVISALRSAGIPVFCAAGNSGSSTGMSAPACVSPAVSLGSVYDENIGSTSFGLCSDAATAADQATCYSNSEAATDLFAPGSRITTSSLGGGVAPGVHGTSFAAPHATACAALLKQARPGIGAAAMENAFKATGVPITDPKNGLTFPRIDCLAAIQVTSCPDADGDGFWTAGPGCPGPPFSDCDDGDASRHPGAPEVCNFVDDNCDGVIDEGFDPDADGLPACADNCPTDANPDQNDRDHDGQGDACDVDDGVIEVWMNSATRVHFQLETGFDRFDVYLGDLGALRDTDGDGAAQDYGACLAEDLAGPDFDDPAVPSPGHGFIYLVTGRSAGTESGLGSASSGVPRPNPHDCASVFGLPPVVSSLTVTPTTRQVACDFTTAVLGRICTLGVPGAAADAPIVVQGSYVEARIVAQVSDDDLADVTATIAPGGTGSIALGDDGSATTFPTPQQATDYGEDCTTDPQTCTCALEIFPVRTGDAAAADGFFTREAALVDVSLPIFLRDCVMQAAARLPVGATPGVPVSIDVQARDRAGHVAAGPASPTVTPGPGTYSCTGDACGCCLLTAGDPVAQCAGLPGLRSPDYPAGICASF